MARTYPPLAERIAAKIEKHDADCECCSGCWHWTGAKTRKGYGKIYGGGRTLSTHRVSYELHIGPLAAEAAIDHTCSRPACVNPEHLEAVTPSENTLRGRSFSAINARKTHCPRGHLYTAESVATRSNGSRDCLICARIRNRERYARLTQAVTA